MTLIRGGMIDSADGETRPTTELIMMVTEEDGHTVVMDTVVTTLTIMQTETAVAGMADVVTSGILPTLRTITGVGVDGLIMTTGTTMMTEGTAEAIGGGVREGETIREIR